MKTYKCLIFHSLLWSHYKGEVFSRLYELVKDTNIDIKVVHIALNEYGRKFLGDIDLSIHRYPYEILFDRPLEETRAIDRILSTLKVFLKYRPDVVVINGWHDYYCWVITLIAKLWGKKVILQNDSTELDKKRKSYIEIFKRIFIKSCDAYMCYGTASINYLKRLGASDNKTFVRVQATDNTTIWHIFQKSLKHRQIKIQKYKWKEKNFIFVGRLSPEKNILTLIKAFASIKKKSKLSDEWGLIIVGDGPQRRAIEDFMKKFGLEDVYLVGGKSWKEVPEYYALADVFVLPSISEPWGLVVNEAMACGLPVIVSKKAGSYWDLVHEGVNGFGFDPYNQQELEDIMLKFVEGKVDIKLMGEKSREIIAPYTPENSARHMLESIKQVLGVR